MIAIGLLECNSIAKGIEATDYILKTANVELIVSRANCPGKYNILFHGEVAAVKESLASGKEIASYSLVDSIIIPRVHSDVIKAINKTTIPELGCAAGVMEFFSIIGAVYAADSAIKTSDISLVDVRLGTGIGGKSFVVLTGDVAAVTAAVTTGQVKAKEEGMLVNSVIIPNPHPDLMSSLY